MSVPIDLVPEFPDQKINVVLDDFSATLRIQWNERYGFWTLSIYTRDQQPVIEGVKMVRDFPLLQGLHLQQFTGDFVFLRINGGKDRPDIMSPGDDFQLLYVSRDELNGI